MNESGNRGSSKASVKIPANINFQTVEEKLCEDIAHKLCNAQSNKEIAELYTTDDDDDDSDTTESGIQTDEGWILEEVLSEEEKRWRALKANVTLIFNYGPYDFRGMIAHRKNRLVGLAEKLTKTLGINVFYKPTDLYNRLSIELDGYVIFTCRITYLKYDNDGLDDLSELAFLKCQEVIEGLRYENERRIQPLRNHYVLMTESFF